MPQVCTQLDLDIAREAQAALMRDWLARDRICVSCGTGQTIELDPRTRAVWYCGECLDRAHPPEFFEDVGVGD